MFLLSFRRTSGIARAGCPAIAYYKQNNNGCELKKDLLHVRKKAPSFFIRKALFDIVNRKE